jgi:hypothetical protein
MLSVTNKTLILSVIMLNVAMLSVVMLSVVASGIGGPSKAVNIIVNHWQF